MPSSLNEQKASWDEAVGVAFVLLQSELCASWVLSGGLSVCGSEGQKVPLGLGDGEANASHQYHQPHTSNQEEGDGRSS